MRSARHQSWASEGVSMWRDTTRARCQHSPWCARSMHEAFPSTVPLRSGPGALRPKRTARTACLPPFLTQSRPQALGAAPGTREQTPPRNKTGCNCAARRIRKRPPNGTGEANAVCDQATAKQVGRHGPPAGRDYRKQAAQTQSRRTWHSPVRPAIPGRGEFGRKDKPAVKNIALACHRTRLRLSAAVGLLGRARLRCLVAAGLLVDMAGPRRTHSSSGTAHLESTSPPHNVDALPSAKPPPTSTREAQLAVSPRPAPCTTPAAQHERAGNTTSLDRCWVGHVKIVSSTVDWQTHHARTSTLKAPSERRNVQSMRAVVHAPGARCQSSAAASFTRSGCAGASPRRQCCAASPPPSRQQARC